MSTTGPGSAHRHKTRSGTWSDLTDVASGSTHTHTLDTSDLATKAELAALAARVAALEAPAPPLPPPPSQVVRPLGPTAVAADFVAAMRDESIDVLELLVGTYRPGIVYLSNADRTRPLLVRPAAGATVVFSGPSTRPAFYLGLGGPVGRITMQDLIFDGYSMGSDGILWTGNAHDLAFLRITVRDCTGTPPYSWGLYVSGDGGVGSSNIVADDWTFDGGNRTVGGLGLGNTSVPRVKNIVARRWKVSNASYAVYSSAGADGVDIGAWTIASSGLTTYAYLSAVFANTSGVIHDCHATDSGGLLCEPPMVDGGGNSWT